MILTNSICGVLYLQIDVDDDPISLNPEFHFEFTFKPGMYIALYWLNGYGEKHFMINNQIFIDGHITIYNVRYVPKIQFIPYYHYTLTSSYIAEQYNLVSFEIEKICLIKCDTPKCVCVSHLNEDMLEEYLSYLVVRAVINKAQLKAIIGDITAQLE